MRVLGIAARRSSLMARPHVEQRATFRSQSVRGPREVTDFAKGHLVESFQNLVVLQFDGLLLPVAIVGLP